MEWSYLELFLELNYHKSFGEGGLDFWTVSHPSSGQRIRMSSRPTVPLSFIPSKEGRGDALVQWSKMWDPLSLPFGIDCNDESLTRTVQVFCSLMTISSYGVNVFLRMGDWTVPIRSFPQEEH